MKTNESSTHWETKVSQRSNLLTLNLRDIWQYRDLVLSFVKRDFVSFYKQTILGPLWYLIQPLASSVILYVIFTKVARLPTGNVPPFLFYLTGNLMWIYFSENVIKTSETFIQNANIFGKVYFPRLTVPVSISISNLITFAIQFGLFVGFYVYDRLSRDYSVPAVNFVFLPFVIMHLAVNSLSVGVIISALTTKYRDLRFTLKFGIQLWMFASPIAYSANQVPTEYLSLYMLNPISPATEGLRHIFFGNSILSFEHLLATAIQTVVLLLLAVLLFNRVEKTFMDTI